MAGGHILRCQIKNAETIDQAREAIIRASETLTVLGTMRYISTLDERDSLVSHSIQQYVEGRVQAAFQQFMEGLNTLKLAQTSTSSTIQSIVFGKHTAAKCCGFDQLFSACFIHSWEQPAPRGKQGAVLLERLAN